jgi:hypothetical protein
MKSSFKRRVLRAGIAAGACAVLLAACGSGDDEAAAGGNNSVVPNSVEACLLRGGAIVARKAGDLQFLSDAEARDEVSKSGLVFDRAARDVVRLWTAPTFEGRPPRWTVWFGQPFNSNQSPSEIVESQPNESYVMFVNRPSPAARRKVSACVMLSGHGEPAAHLHSVR